MILNIKSTIGCFFYIREPLSLSRMQFLKSNQFIWNSEEREYLCGARAASIMEVSDLFKRSADNQFENFLWFENRSVIVEQDLRWVVLKRTHETDILEIEMASVFNEKKEKFDLVKCSVDVEWIFVNQRSEVVYSFQKQAGHPMHQLSDALIRFSKQGLDLAQISDKLSDLEVFKGHEGGSKSFTYRGVVLEYEFRRLAINQAEMKGEIVYLKLKNVQRPFEKFSADFYKVVLNSAAVDIAVFDLEQRYMLINEFAVNNKEVRNWLIGRTDFDYCEFKGTDDSMAKIRKEFFEESKRERKMVEMEEKIVDAEGKTRYSLKRFKPIIVQDEIKYMMGFGMDVTAVIEAQEQLQKSLLEKEALLGEIHHRVKNNLTIVYSLLELQAIQEKNADIAFAYRESQSRIKAMALVHEMLYKSHSFEAIELFAYLKNLAEHLQHLLAVNKTVELKFIGEAVDLPISKAVTCGLFANEILTNSYKYAIPFVENPEIRIRLEEVEGNVEMEISDNGPGLNDDFEEGKNASLGFKLMRTFASQLKGELEIKSQDGLKYLLKFKK
jgi:two-component sensor histidine kinase